MPISALKRAATAGALLVLTASAAAAGSLFPSTYWPANDGELKPHSWTGFIAKPILGYDKLELGGAVSNLLEDPDGFYIGGELGYDKELTGGIVVGVVANAAYSFLDGGSSRLGAGQFETDMEYFGMLRGRLGYASGRFLVFATGGYAFGDLEVTNRFARVSDDESLSGWAAGGGLEYVWNDEITIRAEYIHVDFGSESYSSLPAGLGDLEAEMNLFKLGFVTRY